MSYRCKIICFALAVVLLSIPMIVVSATSLDTFYIDSSEGVRWKVGWIAGYSWNATGKYGDGNFTWSEKGIQRFCALTGKPNLSFASGIIETSEGTFVFQFGTPQNPYKWCYSWAKGYSVLEGNFYLNNTLIGYCYIDNPTWGFIPLRCE